MTYRQTFVVEYPDSSQAPSVGAGMEMLGGLLVACQFSDALAELAALHECCRAVDISCEQAMLETERVAYRLT